jgi:hypothetical protein
MITAQYGQNGESRRTFRAGFGRQAVTVGCNNRAAAELAQVVCGDLILSDAESTRAHYDIVAAGPMPMWSLWNDDRRLYFGASAYQLAYMLLNEIIYQCVAGNDTLYAIHAGAVHNGTKTIMLPGTSGSGKSTLTGWLAGNGYYYLTDELVMVDSVGRLFPCMRPLVLKEWASGPLLKTLAGHAASMVSDNKAVVVPHRLLNPVFSPTCPLLSHLIFPYYSGAAVTQVKSLSPARSLAKLLECHVNARNFEKLGITGLSRLIQRCTSYSIEYSDIAQAERAIAELVAVAGAPR